MALLVVTLELLLAHVVDEVAREEDEVALVERVEYVRLLEQVALKHGLGDRGGQHARGQTLQEASS